MRSSLIVLSAVLVWTTPARPQSFATVDIPSRVDGAIQKALWWAPDAAQTLPVPLVVALHSWSGGYEQKESLQYLERSAKRGWALIHPDFRGYNGTPLSCGSDAAVADVLDAVAFAQGHAKIDPERIYLLGVSGGGYMSLLMASRHPEIWAAVSSWVPISDLAAWYGETKQRGLHYAPDMDAIFGGPPSPANAKEYRHRSPLFALRAAQGLPIDINAGIHDGHTGAVPVSHSLLAFNELAIANGLPQRAISQADIRTIVDTQRIPDTFPPAAPDPAYAKPVLIRREAGPARVTLFEGTHEMLMDAAFAFVEGRRRTAGSETKEQSKPNSRPPSGSKP